MNDRHKRRELNRLNLFHQTCSMMFYLKCATTNDEGKTTYLLSSCRSVNKQHWKIHFGSSEKFELISGGKLRHGGINFFGGEISNFVRLHQLHSSGKNKNCWIISTNLSVRVQQRASAANVEQGRLIFFLDSTRIITVPTCDPIVFGLLPMSQLLPLLLLLWGGINWPKYFPFITVKYRSVKFRSTGETKRVANLRVVTSGGRWGGSR